MVDDRQGVETTGKLPAGVLKHVLIINQGLGSASTAAGPKSCRANHEINNYGLSGITALAGNPPAS